MEDFPKLEKITFDELWGLSSAYCCFAMNKDGIPGDFPWMSLQEGASDRMDRLYKAIEDFYIQHLREFDMEFQTVSDKEVLGVLSAKWNIFVHGARAIHLMFNYLNRFHVPRVRSKSTPQHEYEFHFKGANALESGFFFLENLSLELWRRCFFDRHVDRITMILLRTYNDVRSSEGDWASVTNLSAVCKSYVTMCVTPKPSMDEPTRPNYTYYLSQLEPQLRKATINFYRQRAEEIMIECTINDYLTHVEKLKNNEEELTRQILPGISFAAVMACVTEELIRKYLAFLQDNFSVLLKEGNRPTLTRLYSLISHMKEESLAPFFTIFRHFAYELGTSNLPASSSDAGSYARGLHDTYAYFMDVVSSVFRGNAGFFQAFNEGFGRLVSGNAVAASTTSSSQLMAKYCDSLLRKGQKMDEQSIEVALIDLLNIFQFLNEKDAFLECYHRTYCRRLVHGASLSSELESMVISRLQSLCGHEATSKLRRTMKDHFASESIGEDFSRSSLYSSLSFDFSVAIFATSSWPIRRQDISLRLPPSISQCLSLFSKFYQQKHTARKLIWLHELSTCLVCTNGLGRQHRLILTLFQYSILKLLSEMATKDEAMASSELQSRLGLPLIVFEHQVSSLVSSGLVTKLERENEGEFLRINWEFKHKLVRINLANVKTLRSRREDTDDQESRRQVMRDRAFRVEAIIVREMKTENRMSHARLVEKTVMACSKFFLPDTRTVKHAIDQLIEKSYLERDPEETNVYRYVA